MKIIKIIKEYSMLCLKLKLNDEKPIDNVTGEAREGNTYAIGLPIAICSPLNAKQHWCFKIPLNAGKTC